MTSRKRKFSLLPRIIAESRQCWPHFGLIAVLSLISVPSALLWPLPLKIAVDTLTGHPPRVAAIVTRFFGDFTGIAYAIAVMLGVGLWINLQAMLSSWLNTYTGEKLVWDLRAHLLKHVQRLSMSFHDRVGSREASYRLQHDASSIQYVTVQGFIPLTSAVFTFLGMLYVCARIDRTLALVAFAVSPVLFGLTYVCSRNIRRRSSRIKQLDSAAIRVIDEVLSSMRVIKAFGQEERECDRFVRQAESRMEGQVKLSIVQGGFNAAIGIVICLGGAVALYVGVQHVRQGVLTIGELLVVMAYMSQIYEPLRLMSSKSSELQGWFASLERAFTLYEESPELKQITSVRSNQRAEGTVEFRNVSFSYDGRSNGLRDVSFRVPAGTRVGIIGSTGAGKTTLANLMLRFYEPQQGAILLDDCDLRQLSIDHLRRQFSVVMQEPWLFAASIAENIAYADPEASVERVIEAGKAANCHDFISRMPNGYDTMLGENGARLSSGERQRISLARAFLRNSPIAILDEPTSSVDAQTEWAISTAIDRITAGRTTFIIAHRVNTLKHCDMVLAMHQGELVHVQYEINDEFLRSCSFNEEAAASLELSQQ